MGIDVTMYLKTKSGKEPELERPLPSGYKIIPADECAPDGATHEVDPDGERYYGPHYERGSWPRICSALMLLHACEDVETVWYGGDTCEPSECTPEDVLKISAHFMANGERPYRR